MSASTVTYTCINIPSLSPPIESGFEQGFFVAASVGGGDPLPFQVDTGSAGLVLAEADLDPNYADMYPCFGPGQMNYYPSQNSPTGTWYLVPVTLQTYDSTNQKYTATSITGWAMALVCSTRNADFGMMGVAGKGQNPLYNLFFNLSNSGTPLAPAYSIQVMTKGTTQTVTLTFGQTYTSFESSYEGATKTFLQPTTPPPLPGVTNIPTSYNAPATPLAWTTKAWALPNVSLSLGYSQPSPPINDTVFLTAGFEVDTGIQFMLIAPDLDTFNVLSKISAKEPAINANYPALFPGVKINLAMPGSNAAGAIVLIHEFMLTFTTSTTATGESPGTPPAPTSVLLMPAATNSGTDTIRINVGRNPLASIVYGYDALNGVISWAPVPSS